MSTDVTTAVLEQLTANLPAGVTVFDGSVPGQPPSRYVVVYGDIGVRSVSGTVGTSDDQSFTVQVTSVAGDPYSSAACRRLAEGVRDILVDWVPSVDGLGTSPFQHTVSRRPVVDESVSDRHVVFAVDQFLMLASR